jgi:hypothetical protein
VGSGRRRGGGDDCFRSRRMHNFIAHQRNLIDVTVHPRAEMNGSDAQVWAQSNVEDPRNYKGDPTPSEGTKGTEISIEKKKEVSRMIVHDNAEGVERGEFG